jgi:hypothetical protein
MTYVAVAIGGSALVGAYSANKAAKAQAGAAGQAAELQKDVADQQVELQREQFNRQVELQRPFRESGLAAQNQLLTLLGIRPQQAPEATRSGGGGGFGGVAGMIGNAAATAMRQQQGPGLQVDPNSPDFGRYARDFSMADYQADPGYAFRMSEGMKGLERSAAARGGLLSGATMKGIQRFGQDLASQEYSNAFNRYQTNRAARLNPLQSLAGVGQTSAQQVGAAGQNMAAGIGNALGAYGQGASEALGAAGQARASGYMGTANALTGALGQYMNYGQSQQQNALLQQMIGRGNSPTNAQLAAQMYGG